MKEHIWKIDLVVIGVSVLVLLVLFGYSRPLVIAPIDEYESVNGEVLFSFERADVLLVDDNSDFTSPDEYRVVDGERVNLEPGVYYWKVSGVLGSEVRTLTILSRVELELVEKDGEMAVVNAGNVRLNVDVYDGEELVDKMKLDKGDASIVEGEDSVKIVGEYDE